ncbi:hypothetical protein [Paenibacillus sp. sgz302251]|uniref:hypothetical protein n=1 Tax=Paenibacillus sp. sgz302251 TaxID=3414493 RepID=UPI003C7DE5BA
MAFKRRTGVAALAAALVIGGLAGAALLPSAKADPSVTSSKVVNDNDQETNDDQPSTAVDTDKEVNDDQQFGSVDSDTEIDDDQQQSDTDLEVNDDNTTNSGASETP